MHLKVLTIWQIVKLIKESVNKTIIIFPSIIFPSIWQIVNLIKESVNKTVTIVPSIGYLTPANKSILA